MTGDLSPESIEAALGARLGRPFRFLEEVGSTNTEALAWAVDGAPHGALVVTDHQTAGRGRWSRPWVSAPGALLQFSLVLRPKLQPDEFGLLTTALGVACAEAIEAACGASPTIKWPNDVRIRGKKVAGILVESHLAGGDFEAAIAGTGINVGWREDEIPVEMRETATSLGAEGGGPVPSRAELLGTILRALEPYLDRLPDGREQLLARAAERSDVLGSDVTVRFSDGRRLHGRAEALSDQGGLLVRQPQGTTVVTVGEVEQLRGSQAPR